MAAGEEARRRARRGRAYFVLAAAAVLGVITSFFWSAHLADQAAAQQRQLQEQQQQTHDGLCSLLVPASTPRLPAPSVTAGPTARQAYAWQQRYIAVANEFHCKETP